LEVELRFRVFVKRPTYKGPGTREKREKREKGRSRVSMSTVGLDISNGDTRKQNKIMGE
jgi:hypothetical protein